MTNSVNIVPFEVVNGLDGKPLTNGKVYIGQPNQDPEQYPVTLYWDAAGTIPAAQPIRTVGGYISRRGTPAQLYVSGNYSLRVRTANNVQVYYVPDVFMTGSQEVMTVIGGVSSVDSISALRLFAPKIDGQQVSVIAYYSGWAAMAAPPTGGGIFVLNKSSVAIDDGGYNISAVGGGCWERVQVGDAIDVRSFGAKLDATAVSGAGTDDTVAIQKSLNYAYAGKIRKVNCSNGMARLTAKITIPSWVEFTSGQEYLPDPSNGAHVFQNTLCIDWGSGLNSNAVELSHSSSISGFTFYYPQQAPKSSPVPVIFGFSISTPDAISVYDNLNVRFITLYNSYKGIRLNNSGRWNVSNIQGNPLFLGITADSCLDVCYMEKVHFWNFYTQNDLLESWVSANGTAYELRRIDQLFASKLFGWNYNVCFHCRDGLWANFTDILCDKSNFPFIIQQSSQILVENFVLIGNAAAKPAIWGRSVSSSAKFSNGTIANTSSVGVQIDDGTAYLFNNVAFDCPHSALISTNDSPDIRLDNCTYKIPPFGSYNIIIDGERLPQKSSVITLPAPILAPAVIPGGYSFSLSDLTRRSLQYDTTYISQKNSLFVLSFDYQLIGSNATWYFQFSLGQDVGNNKQVLFEPFSAMIINQTDTGGARRINIPFFINYGKFKQILNISTVPTVAVAGSSLQITNIVLYEQENSKTTNSQVSNMMRKGYNLDCFNMGQTLYAKGKNRIVITEPEAGIGRPTPVPTYGSWLAGDEMLYNEQRYLCTVSGAPGTWVAK